MWTLNNHKADARLNDAKSWALSIRNVMTGINCTTCEGDFRGKTAAGPFMTSFVTRTKVKLMTWGTFIKNAFKSSLQNVWEGPLMTSFMNVPLRLEVFVALSWRKLEVCGNCSDTTLAMKTLNRRQTLPRSKFSQNPQLIVGISKKYSLRKNPWTLPKPW